MFSCIAPVSPEFDESGFNLLYTNINSNFSTPVKNDSFQIIDNQAMFVECVDGIKLDQGEFEA